jgi:hypothetical protein
MRKRYNIQTDSERTVDMVENTGVSHKRTPVS